MKEKAAGKERLKVALKGFRSGLLPQQLGDPVAGATAYTLCIYAGDETLAGTLRVDRAGETCGTKPCWKALGSKGWKYRDAEASSDGVNRLIARSGTGKARVIVAGRNKERKALTALPTGIAATLAGSERATVRVLTSDAGCFGATLDRVRKDTGTFFKATGR